MTLRMKDSGREK